MVVSQGFANAKGLCGKTESELLQVLGDQLLLLSIIAYTSLSPHYSIPSFEEDIGHYHAITIYAVKGTNCSRVRKGIATRKEGGSHGE